MTEKRAFYFGCLGRMGHYLHSARERYYDTPHGLPWTPGNMDGGLLRNGKHPDIYDGKVFWTCGGNPVVGKPSDRVDLATLWLAFVWWDNSVDHRAASNSGFYVQGFNVATERQQALNYACSVFPQVKARQRQPLVLQP